MGYSLAWQAGHPYWLGVLPSEIDRAVLERMALLALDPDTRNNSGAPPCMYFAGREPLMVRISRDGQLPELGSPAYDTLKKKVQRSIGRLIKAGAIERVEQAKTQKVSRYRLTLGAALYGSRGVLTTPLQGGPESPPGWIQGGPE